MKKLFCIIILMLSIFNCQKYDTLVDKDEACNQSWSDYESQLKRRSDMIPQLVAVVKGSSAHEHDTLKDVIEARASATKVVLDPKNDDFSNPEKVKQFAQAQGQIGTALSRLMMVQEQYPDLKANTAFANLQTDIEGTENRLNRARQQYNAAVKEYNTELRHISGKIVNPITGHEFMPRVYFQADEADKATPTIDFSNKSAK